MTLQTPNPAPRSGALLREILTDPADRFVVVDVGARGGVEAQWASIRPVTDMLGFDPDPAECERLNAVATGGDRFFPYAVGDRVGTQPFYLTRFPYSSGFRAGRSQWLRRFPISTLDVMRQVEVPTITLDRLAEDEGIRHIDFLKIDTEGSEYEVLSGAGACLRERRVLGVKTELWWDPVIKGQKGFAEIDLFLRGHGLRFYDLQLKRYPRSTLPAGRVRGVIGTDGSVRVGPGPSYGQAWTGDALYFRDPVGEHHEGRAGPEWDAKTLLRLCGLLDIFDYGDCAIEILEVFRDRLEPACDVDALIDAIVPPVDGQILPYDTYLALSAPVRMAQNARLVPSCRWRPGPTAYGRRRRG